MSGRWVGVGKRRGERRGQGRGGGVAVRERAVGCGRQTNWVGVLCGEDAVLGELGLALLMRDRNKGLFLMGLIIWRVEENGGGIFLGRSLLGEFLGGNFFGSKKAATWATGTTHRMLVAGFMEIRLVGGG